MGASVRAARSRADPGETDEEDGLVKPIHKAAGWAVQISGTTTPERLSDRRHLLFPPGMRVG